MCFWPVDMFPFSPLCLENIGTFQYQGDYLKIPRFLASLKNILRSGSTGSAFPRGGSSLWGRVRTAVQMRQALPSSLPSPVLPNKPQYGGFLYIAEKNFSRSTNLSKDRKQKLDQRPWVFSLVHTSL